MEIDLLVLEFDVAKVYVASPVVGVEIHVESINETIAVVVYYNGAAGSTICLACTVGLDPK